MLWKLHPHHPNILTRLTLVFLVQMMSPSRIQFLGNCSDAMQQSSERQDRIRQYQYRLKILISHFGNAIVKLIIRLFFLFMSSTLKNLQSIFLLHILQPTENLISSMYPIYHYTKFPQHFDSQMQSSTMLRTLNQEKINNLCTLGLILQTHLA